MITAFLAIGRRYFVSVSEGERKDKENLWLRLKEMKS